MGWTIGAFPMRHLISAMIIAPPGGICQPGVCEITGKRSNQYSLDMQNDIDIRELKTNMAAEIAEIRPCSAAAM